MKVKWKHEGIRKGEDVRLKAERRYGGEKSVQVEKKEKEERKEKRGYNVPAVRRLRIPPPRVCVLVVGFGVMTMDSVRINMM